MRDAFMDHAFRENEEKTNQLLTTPGSTSTALPARKINV